MLLEAFVNLEETYSLKQQADSRKPHLQADDQIDRYNQSFMNDKLKADMTFLRHLVYMKLLQMADTVWEAQKEISYCCEKIETYLWITISKTSWSIVISSVGAGNSAERNLLE